MFVISFNICLFIYFSVKYAIQSNDCDVFVNKQSIYLSNIEVRHTTNSQSLMIVFYNMPQHLS